MKRINITNFYALLIYLTATNTIFAKDPFWKLATQGMTKSSPRVIITIFSIFIIIILVLILIYLKKENEIEKKSIEIDKKKLKNNITTFGLNKDETDIMLQLKKENNLIDSNSIFYESTLFEKLFLQYIQNKYDYNSQIISQKSIDKKTIEEGKKLYNILSNIRNKLDFEYKQEKLPLCSTLQLKKGIHIHIRNPHYARGIEAKLFDNNAFFFVVELVRMATFDFKVGNEYELFFDRDGQYKFNSQLLYFDNKFLYLSHTLKLTRNQFRKYVRYDVDIPAKIALIKRVENKKNTHSIFDGKIKDISGGGIKLNTTQELFVNDILSIVAKWDHITIDIKVQILRVKIVETQTKTIFFGFCKYIDIDKTLKEQLIKHIFYNMKEDIKLIR